MLKAADIRPDRAKAELARLIEEERRRFVDGTGRLRPEFGVHVDCPVCGGKGRLAYDADVEPAFQQCTGCGCVYADPRLRAEVFDDYLRHATSRAFFAQHMLLATESARRDQVFRPRLELLRFPAPAGRVLELGSAVGTFLGLLAEAGYEAEGIELCGFSIEHSRGLGHRVHDRVIEELDLPAGSFDAVCAWGVFCHLVTPRDTVAAIFAALRPGGNLAFTATNCLSFEHLTLRARHPIMNPLLCCQFYAPRATEDLLAAAGFVDISIETPGQTDVQMVRDTLGRPDPSLGHFLNHILFDDSSGANERRDHLQRWIASQRMSGHMVVTARKPNS